MESQIGADPNCPICHGSGVVIDWVDYGSTTVSMEQWCNCVTREGEIDDECE